MIQYLKYLKEVTKALQLFCDVVFYFEYLLQT